LCSHDPSVPCRYCLGELVVKSFFPVRNEFRQRPRHDEGVALAGGRPVGATEHVGPFGMGRQRDVGLPLPPPAETASVIGDDPGIAAVADQLVAGDGRAAGKER
jgi:hypothetical protein